jgi:formylglycine-generating enzyme required for sulfatase activity
MNAIFRYLLQAPIPPPTPTPAPSFWEANGDKIIVAVVTAILVLLLSEPLKALLKKLGGWLERAWQALGFGFEKRYLKALASQHQWLRLIGIYNKTALNPPRLQNVFVSLRIASAAASENDPRFAWEKLFDDEHKSIVIIGQPGTGKTTLLDYFILIFTGHLAHPLRKKLGAPLPLYARLRDLNVIEGARSLLDVLQAPASTSLSSLPPTGFFERRLRNKDCLVLLDGLDEVLDQAAHQRAVDEIQRFAAEYPGNCLVVTCRVAGWKNQLPGFQVYQVQEFDRDDIQHFIANWYGEVLRTQVVNALGPMPAPEDQQQAEQSASVEARQETAALWNALRQNEGLLRIARTPLILSLITLVHKTHRDLPKGRARLYSECLEVLLEKWDMEDKRLKTPDSPALDEKLAALKAIAKHYLNEGVLEMDAAELQELVAPLLPSFSVKITPAVFIRQIIERSGVLVEQAVGRYGFAHRALHDYLSASAIVDQGNDALLLGHAAEERWREVILIAIRLVKIQARAETLLDALLTQSGESAASLALAGWSLAEGVTVKPELRVAVKERLLTRLAQVETAIDFGLLTSALLTSDLSAARDWMREALAGRDPKLSQRVLGLLPDLEAQAAAEFIPLVTRLLAEPQESAALRAAAALALAKLNPELADSAVWFALQVARQSQNEDALKATATWAWCELGRYEELGLVKVPAGEFVIGSDRAKDGEAYDDEQPQHRLYMPKFYVARYPVTGAEWYAYCEASGREPERAESLQGLDNHPVRYVTWNESLAYAQWHGFGLPSEAEWEKAARGADERIYPWGDAWQAGRANTDELWQSSTGGCLRRLFRRNVTRTTTPVGQFSPLGDTPYGCADMSGNVWEWTRSIFEGYPYDPTDGREDLQSKGARVLRGGSFDYSRRLARCAYRNWHSPGSWYGYRGFRVGVVSPILISDL